MLSPKQTTYRVRPGDTLSGIAKSQYGNPAVWPDIAKVNRIPASNLILVGALLRLPPVQQSQPLAPIGRTSSLLADVLARPVSFPAVKFSLMNLPAMIVSTPQADYKLRLTGDVTLQKKGSMTEIEVSNSATVSGKLKSEYESKLLQLAGNVDISWSPLAPGQAGISCGLTTATKINGKAFVTQEYTFTPPNVYKFSVAPKPIRGDYKDVVFVGSMGYELEVDFKNSDMRLPFPGISTDAVVTLAALFVLGVPVIVDDLLAIAGTVPWSAALLAL
jgi:LysM repeat protein